MTILVAGTFAKIHEGHKKLISAAHDVSISFLDKVEISLASSEYVNKYKTYDSGLWARTLQMEKYLEDTYGYYWKESFKTKSFDSISNFW